MKGTSDLLSPVEGGIKTIWVPFAYPGVLTSWIRAGISETKIILGTYFPFCLVNLESCRWVISINPSVVYFHINHFPFLFSCELILHMNIADLWFYHKVRIMVTFNLIVIIIFNQFFFGLSHHILLCHGISRELFRVRCVHLLLKQVINYWTRLTDWL